jgi:6-phosphogluconolactonase (cycloisomerase 2 family)
MGNVSSTPGTPAGAPIDNGISMDGRNFYVLNGNQGSISVFCIRDQGGLTRLQVIDTPQIPNTGTQGLAAK